MGFKDLKGLLKKENHFFLILIIWLLVGYTFLEFNIEFQIIGIVINGIVIYFPLLIICIVLFLIAFFLQADLKKLTRNTVLKGIAFLIVVIIIFLFIGAEILFLIGVVSFIVSFIFYIFITSIFTMYYIYRYGIDLDSSFYKMPTPIAFTWRWLIFLVGTAAAVALILFIGAVSVGTTKITVIIVIAGQEFFIHRFVEIIPYIIVGIILGAMVGGTSSPIVIPLASRLKNLQDKTKTVLSIESIITDPLCIVVVLAIVTMISSEGGINLGVGARDLVSTFSVGAVTGLVLGFIWLPIMHKVRKEQFSYILTLAVVFLVYSLTETWWQGAGAISCLAFGLVLGNGKKILKMVNYSGRGFEMDQDTKQFHSLTSFVIRTFFFVYLGIMVSFQNIEFIILGIIILVVLLVVRYLAILITTYRGNFEKDDKQTMSVMMPRGLAAAILAVNFGPLILEKLDLEIGNAFFKDIVFVVILGTAIICTIGVSIISHYEMKKLKTIEDPISKSETIDKQDDLLEKT